MYIGLHVKYRYSCQIWMKFESSRQIFEKYSNIKFHENTSCVSRVFPCGQTDGQADGRADATKLLVAFHNFTKEPKIFISVAEVFENLFLFSASNGNKFRIVGK